MDRELRRSPVTNRNRSTGRGLPPNDRRHIIDSGTRCIVTDQGRINGVKPPGFGRVVDGFCDETPERMCGKEENGMESSGA